MFQRTCRCFVNAKWSQYSSEITLAEVATTTTNFHGKVQKKVDVCMQAMAWKFKSKGKLVVETVGYLPKEISHTAWFFLERGGKICGNVLRT